MTRDELVDAVHDGTVSKQQTADIIQRVFDTIGSEVRSKGHFAYHNFGRFRLHERGARKGRNPSTGESIDIPAKKTVKFKAAAALDALL